MNLADIELVLKKIDAILQYEHLGRLVEMSKYEGIMPQSVEHSSDNRNILLAMTQRTGRYEIAKRATHREACDF